MSAPSAIQKHAVVAARRPLSRSVIELVLSPLRQGGEPFHAGQYWLIAGPGGRSRPYSIASSPRHPDEIRICFNRVPQGHVSVHLSELSPGEKVAYSGPHGSFLLRDGPPRDLLFVAGGTGISPLRSMILDLLERQAPVRIDLLFGTRHDHDIIYAEEFEHLQQHFANFTYHVTLSRPPETGWDGHRGRVTQVLPLLFADLRGRDAYVCGRPEMVDDTIAILASMGIDRSRCFREEG